MNMTFNIQTVTTLANDVSIFYHKARRPIAFALVVIAAFPRLIPVPNIQLAALVALGAIILETLFEVQKQVATNKPSRVFPEFYSVSQEIQRSIAKTIDTKHVVHIRALGMSMGHAWPFLVNTLQPFLASNQKQEVHLEIAILDSRWNDLQSINSDWPARSKTNFDEIERFFEVNRKRLTDKGWLVSVYRYRHIPNWHGVLIDNDALFLSTCFWRDKKLMGAENVYELFLRNESEVGAQRIYEFISWFEYIRQVSESN